MLTWTIVRAVGVPELAVFWAHFRTGDKELAGSIDIDMFYTLFHVKRSIFGDGIFELVGAIVLSLKGPPPPPLRPRARPWEKGHPPPGAPLADIHLTDEIDFGEYLTVRLESPLFPSNCIRPNDPYDRATVDDAP